MNLRKYIAELKRRNVIKAGFAYLVVAWVLLQVFSILLPLFEAPLWVLRTITLLMAIGFPIWLVFSWIYEITPEGIKKTKQIKSEESESNKTGRKLNKLIIVFLSIAVVFLLVKLNWNQSNNEDGVTRQFEETENLSSNLKALDFYFKGELHHKKETHSDIDAAIDYYKKAIDNDSLFAKAYSRLASAYMRKSLSFDLNSKWEAEAYSAAKKALQLDPKLANPHVIQGQFFWSKSHDFAHEEAINEFKKALLKDSRSINAYEQLSLVQFHIGLFDKALSNANKSIELDPGNYRARRFIGETLMFSGKYKLSLVEFEKIPKYFAPQLTQTLLALNHFYLSNSDKAVEMLDNNLNNSPNNNLSNSAYAIILASKGKYMEAEQKMELALENSEDLIHVHHVYYQLGLASAIMNKNQIAVQWLKKAADTGFPNYPLFSSDPFLKNLEGDKEYEELVLKLKEKWNYFKSL
jgi:tetratricopeptide (TPR) repeat protein